MTVRAREAPLSGISGVKLDFGHSGREAGGLGEAVEDGAGNFRDLGVIR